jgi:hypothetical protein
MKKLSVTIGCTLLCTAISAQSINRGATEKSESKSEYFAWINNTNEGPDEKQTLINLDFFKWMRDEYGMQLDIYAFDSGVIDGKNIYGSIYSDKFKRFFPHGFNKIYQKASQMNTRLGLWGGPDGFGNTKESAEQRKAMLESLCRDYHWALFKFDMVCGPLRHDKEADFINLMTRCRRWSPDLILLNHRLGLETAEKYATTFLWEGRESYIDVNSTNTTTATHSRVGAMARGLVPGMQRLTEDHGVCLSSCLDYWDDELILQAFNRSLLLSPQIYGNPWLLRDSEFPKLARIFNLHKVYSKLLVNGMALPQSYGDAAVSRGNDSTRLITLRNLGWTPRKFTVKLDEEIGLKTNSKVTCMTYHPTEKVLGTYHYGDKLEVTVLPFRTILLCISSVGTDYGQTILTGTDYEVVKDIPGMPVLINLLGMPGTEAKIGINHPDEVAKATINGKDITDKLRRGNLKVSFLGKKLTQDYHRKLADMHITDVPEDAATLYEATAFSADNNALEVQSLHRSGPTAIPQVKAARDAFFKQNTFINRAIWDKNLFDGDKSTLFAVSKAKGDQRIKGGCLRLDLGEEMFVDSILVRIPNEYLLQPLIKDEGNYFTISSDLTHWQQITFWASTDMYLPINSKMRYLKMKPFPDAISEIEVYSGGKKVAPTAFKVSNLMADGAVMYCNDAWKTTFVLNETPRNSYLCVAINGQHGVEQAYAALKVDGHYVGAPTRTVSYPINPWENRVAKKESNYTYFFPVDPLMAGKKIEVFVLGYNEQKMAIKPQVWITAYPIPFETKTMTINYNR